VSVGGREVSWGGSRGGWVADEGEVGCLFGGKGGGMDENEVGRALR
jgi:hypothetical protein